MKIPKTTLFADQYVSIVAGHHNFWYLLTLCCHSQMEYKTPITPLLQIIVYLLYWLCNNTAERTWFRSLISLFLVLAVSASAFRIPAPLHRPLNSHFSLHCNYYNRTTPHHMLTRPLRRGWVSHRISIIHASSTSTTPQTSTSRASTTSRSNNNSQDRVICPRSENYARWYSDVLAASGMVDDSPVRGCAIIRPWGMRCWELLRDELDARIRASGAQNAYFPLFIPQSFLSREAEHVDGFAKECAVVTHHRLNKNSSTGKLQPDPDAQLAEPLIVRPTSETVIWSSFARWVRSYRDLPLKINQWANVVRWEMRPRPFLRTAEFLWQEGHTAHATSEDAMGTTSEMLNIYADVVESMLAIPVIQGEKSPSERFAGAEKTLTIEGMMQNGWALQCGTSHFLGQNFARAFDVYFSTDKKTDLVHDDSVSPSGEAASGRELVWGTSWGVSTRLLGAMIMSHSDDVGLVLPPRVAPLQVVIVPIVSKKNGSIAIEGSGLSDPLHVARLMEQSLKKGGVRCQVDDRPSQLFTLGAKRYEWERRGVPLRIEIGEKDLARGSAVLCSRYNGAKRELPISLIKPSVEGTAFSESSFQELTSALLSALEDVQQGMLGAARDRLLARTVMVHYYDEMKKAILSASAVSRDASWDSDIEGESHAGDRSSQPVEASMNTERAGTPNKGGFVSPCFFLAPWHDDADNEAAIKADCKATIRCFPFEHNEAPPAQGVKCFYSGRQATHIALFARAF